MIKVGDYIQLKNNSDKWLINQLARDGYKFPMLVKKIFSCSERSSTEECKNCPGQINDESEGCFGYSEGFSMEVTPTDWDE